MRKAWWDKSVSSSNVHQHIFRTIKTLELANGARRAKNLKNYQTYASGKILSLNGGDYDVTDGEADMLRYNVAQSIVDTIVATITATKPRPYVYTENGNTKLRRQARKLMQFIDGQFASMGQHTKISPEVVRDAAIFGDGFQKIIDGGDCVETEHVFADEILVDAWEARYKTPRSLYQIKDVAREVVAHEYADTFDGEDLAKHVEKAGLFRDAPAIGSEATSDMVQICEAWHLPSGEGANDGRHVVCLSNVTLLDEPWEDSFFPFARFSWQPQRGFWSRGAVEIVSGIQAEIEFLNGKIRKIITLVAPWIFVGPDAGLPKGKLTNDGLSIIPVNNPDQIRTVVFDAIPASLFNERAELARRAFEMVGISQMSASSQKPAGIDSGAGLRTLANIESKRFLHVSRAYEQFHVDVGEQMIALAQRIDKRGDGGLEIMARSKDGLERIKWSEVAMPGDKYQLRTAPTNFFATEPASKFEQAKELAEAIPEFQAYIGQIFNDYPDVSGILALTNAPLEMAQTVITRILETGRYESPEPFMDLALTIKVASLTYLKERGREDADDDPGLDALRQFIEDAQAMLQPAEQPAPMQGAEQPPADIMPQQGVM